MFLDDQLYQIITTCDKTEEGYNKALRTMFSCALDSVTEKTKLDNSNDAIIAQFKRVNNIWIRVADRLEKEGKLGMNRDGFKKVVMTLEIGPLVFKD